MRRTTVLLVAALALGGFAAGCTSPEEEAAAGNEQQLAAIREAKQRLDASRANLASLRQQLADARDADDEQRVAVLEQQVTQAEEQVANQAESFGSDLVAYINALEIPQGGELTPEQQAAMRMKSDEDIELANEWIERGGDYRRALEIYEAQLIYDPDYDRLIAARDRATEMRYMTQERFEQVEKGMTQQQVRNLLGPVNLHNVVEYEEEGVVAWFYPKEDKSAAGVWFKREREGQPLTAYQVSFDVSSREREGTGS